MDLTLEEHARNGWLVIEVKGELDMATAPQLTTRLLELIATGHTHMVVALTSLAFMDSSGLNALLTGWKSEKEHGGTLRVVCSPTPALTVLHLSGVDQIIPVYSTLAEALAGPVAD